MSNYLSKEFEKTKIESSFNAPLADKVLATLQGKYDVNKAKIDQTLAIFKDQLKGRRDVDNQYIAARIGEAQSLIAGYGKKDFSLTSTTQTLKSSLDAVVQDPIIQEAVLNKAKVDQFNLKVDEKRKKGDGSYNDTNYSYSLYKGGVDSYDRGESNKIGNLNYVDYYDDAKEFKDFAENLDKYDESIERTSNPSGDGYLYTQKGNRLTESDIRNKVTTLLSDKAKNQMRVNAWATYEQGETEAERNINTLSAFSKFKTKEVENLNDTITKAELDVKNGTVTKESLTNLKKYKTELNLEYSSWEKDPLKNRSLMSNTMYFNNKVNNFAKSFAFDNVGTTISSDATFIQKQNFEYKQQQDAWERDYKTEQLRLEQYKAGVTTDKNGNAITSSDIQQKADPNYTPESEYENLVDKQNERVNSYDPLIKTATNTILQSLDEDTKKLVQARVEASKGKLTAEDVLVELGETNHQIVSAKGYKELSEYRMDKALEQEVITKYTKQVQEEQNKALDTDLAIKELYDNSNVKMMWKGKDGKEGLFSVRDVMIANGIVDNNGKKLKGISEVKSVFENLKKSMWADKIITSTSDNPRVTNYVALRELSKMFGENSDKVASGGTEFGDTIIFNPNTKTGQFIINQKMGGGYDKNWSNDSFDDISSTNSYADAVSPETIKKRVGELLQKDETLSIGKINMVSPKSPSFKALQGVLDNKLDDGIAIAIVPIPSQPNMVQITQQGIINAAGKTTPGISEQMRIQDLPSEITSQINLTYKRKVLTIKNVPTIETPVNYRTEIDKSALKDITETHFKGNKKEALKTYRNGALDYLFGLNPQVMGTVGNPTEIGTQIIEIIDKVPTVGLKKGHSNDIYPTISLGGKEVWVSDDWYTDNNLKEIYDIKTYTPQIVVNNWLANIITSPNYSTKLKEIYGK